MDTMEKAKAEFAQLQEIAGISFEGIDDSKGLAGGIKSITEDTAHIIAGQMGAIRVNVAEQTAIAQSSLDHLSEIAVNTRLLRDIKDLLSDGDGSMRATGS